MPTVEYLLLACVCGLNPSTPSGADPSAGGAPAGKPVAMRFTDVTRTSGIDFKFVCGQMPSREILEVSGGGVAFIDYDNDGDFDLFFANGATMADPNAGPGSRLYANKGDGTFFDVTEQVGIDVKRWAMGVAVGDYDNDGWDDLYITCYGPNILLHNDGRGGHGRRFVDLTAQAGVGDASWGTSAAFGDIDGDGDLDLYVANYLEFDIAHPPSREGSFYKGVTVMAGPHGLIPQPDVLYENLGNGRFKDITTSSGCVPERPGYGFVALMIDFDRDGHEDIFVGNDSTENFLFHNLGEGRFEDVGMLSGIALNMDGSNQATMGIAVADVDSNGLPDVFTTNFSSDTNTLHVNLDGAFFDDRTFQYGLGLVSRPFLSWGCGFFDFDSDGDEDLFISSGHVYPEALTQKLDSDYEQPPLLFDRDGKRFHRVVDAGDIFKTPLRGRAVAFGDLDGDGDVDVVLTTLNDRVRILRNDADRVDALVVALQYGPSNHRGYGSEIELVQHGTTQRRWIHGGGSFQSVDAPEAYFGLGAHSDATVTLRVTWPDGKVTQIDDLHPNRRITIVRGAKEHHASLLRGRSK